MTGMDAEIEKYKSMLANDPQSKAFAPLAEAYRKMGQLEEALEACKHGLSMHPDYSGAQLLLGRILMDMKRFTEAGQALTSVIKRIPSHLMAHQLLSRVYLQQGQLAHAKAIASRILKISPDDAAAKAIIDKPASPAPEASLQSTVPTVTMARLYEEQGHLDKALEIYKEIVSSSPEVAADIKRIKKHFATERQISVLQNMLKKVQEARK